MSYEDRTSYKGYSYLINPEQDHVENPFDEFDMTCSVVTWMRSYELSSRDACVDKDKRRKLYDSPTEVLDALKSGDLVYAAPLYAYIHSGITVNLGSMDYRWPDQQWDCGLAGMVYITKEKAKEAWPNYGGRVLQYVCEKRAKEEVKVLDQWCTGDVWYFTTYDKDGEDLDSCGWIYGYKDAEQAAKESIDYHIKAEESRIKETVEQMWQFGMGKEVVI